MFWDDGELKSQPEQVSRIDRAASLFVENVDFCANSGKINGHEVTLDNCNCRDYFVRRQPCKHMYRLAHELKLFTLPGTVSNRQMPPLTREKAKQIVQKNLSESEQQYLYDVLYLCIYGCGESVGNQQDIQIESLVANDLIKATADPLRAIATLKKADLINAARNEGLAVNSNANKSILIKNILSLKPALLDALAPKNVYVTLTDEFSPHARSIYNILAKKFRPQWIWEDIQQE